MTQISFLELFAGWSPELCVFAGLFGFVLFAMAAITLITTPVTPRGRTPRTLTVAPGRTAEITSRPMCGGK